MIFDQYPLLGVWTDLYATTGIASTSRLAIQNKSASPALVWEGSSPPGINGGDNKHGFLLYIGSDPYVTQANAGCWILHAEPATTSRGRLCVQEYTP